MGLKAGHPGENGTAKGGGNRSGDGIAWARELPGVVCGGGAGGLGGRDFCLLEEGRDDGTGFRRRVRG